MFIGVNSSIIFVLEQVHCLLHKPLRGSTARTRHVLIGLNSHIKSPPPPSASLSFPFPLNIFNFNVRMGIFFNKNFICTASLSVFDCCITFPNFCHCFENGIKNSPFKTCLKDCIAFPFNKLIVKH